MLLVDAIKETLIKTKKCMNIEEENKAKQYYINSNIEGIHYQNKNTVEINYLDMLKLMVGFANEVKKVKCSNCNDIVEMMSTGECCPSCFC